jgi:hypothetical protein
MNPPAPVTHTVWSAPETNEMLSWAGMFCVQEARNKLGKKKYGG